MHPQPSPHYLAFAGDRCLGTGALREVARLTKRHLDKHPDASLLVFDGGTGGVVDIDFRGTVSDVLARLPAVENGVDAATTGNLSPPRGPGRPKLGVVAREVTLLPRHWEWLARQSGGASVALRKLVDEARRGSADGDRIREAQEATYRFMSAISGNRAHFEEASRALFAGQAADFERWIAAWPADVRRHVLEFAETAFRSDAPATTA